jgi:putative transposase
MHYGKPTELVWSHLKRSLANLAKRSIGQLTALVKTRLKRMQYRPGSSRGSSPAPAWTSPPPVTPKIEDR